MWKGSGKKGLLSGMKNYRLPACTSTSFCIWPICAGRLDWSTVDKVWWDSRSDFFIQLITTQLSINPHWIPNMVQPASHFSALLFPILSGVLFRWLRCFCGSTCSSYCAIFQFRIWKVCFRLLKIFIKKPLFLISNLMFM